MQYIFSYVRVLTHKLNPPALFSVSSFNNHYSKPKPPTMPIVFCEPNCGNKARIRQPSANSGLLTGMKSSSSIQITFQGNLLASPSLPHSVKAHCAHEATKS